MNKRHALELVIGALNRAPFSHLELAGLQAALAQLDALVVEHEKAEAAKAKPDEPR
jgi:hypothetical protein